MTKWILIAYAILMCISVCKVKGTEAADEFSFIPPPNLIDSRLAHLEKPRGEQHTGMISNQNPSAFIPFLPHPPASEVGNDEETNSKWSNHFNWNFNSLYTSSNKPYSRDGKVLHSSTTRSFDEYTTTTKEYHNRTVTPTARSNDDHVHHIGRQNNHRHRHNNTSEKTIINMKNKTLEDENVSFHSTDRVQTVSTSRMAITEATTKFNNNHRHSNHHLPSERFMPHFSTWEYSTDSSDNFSGDDETRYISNLNAIPTRDREFMTSTAVNLMSETWEINHTGRPITSSALLWLTYILSLRLIVAS